MLKALLFLTTGLLASPQSADSIEDYVQDDMENVVQVVREGKPVCQGLLFGEGVVTLSKCLYADQVALYVNDKPEMAANDPIVHRNVALAYIQGQAPGQVYYELATRVLRPAVAFPSKGGPKAMSLLDPKECKDIYERTNKRYLDDMVCAQIKDIETIIYHETDTGSPLVAKNRIRGRKQLYGLYNTYIMDGKIPTYFYYQTNSLLRFD